MHRRNFIKSVSIAGSSIAISGVSGFSTIAAGARMFSPQEESWFDRSMRWAQLAFVENNPGNYDPDFWLDYFKKAHVDGVLLSAGGIVAFFRPKYHCTIEVNGWVILTRWAILYPSAGR